MPSVVNDSCIKCGTCASVCPVSAFHVCDTQMVVDPDTCIDCGVCIPNARKVLFAMMRKLMKNGLNSMLNKQKFARMQMINHFG